MEHRFEYEGHTIIPSLSDEEGGYAFTLTLSYTPGYGVSSYATRGGLIWPRSGSTLSQVKSDLFNWMRSMTGGQNGSHVVLFWSLEPNITF